MTARQAIDRLRAQLVIPSCINHERATWFHACDNSWKVEHSFSAVYESSTAEGGLKCIRATGPTIASAYNDLITKWREHGPQ